MSRLFCGLHTRPRSFRVKIRRFLGMFRRRTLLFSSKTHLFRSSLKNNLQSTSHALIREKNQGANARWAVPLEYDDLPEVLVKTFRTPNVGKLIRRSWANDGVMPFDRRVAIQLAVDEAERFEAQNRINLMISDTDRAMSRTQTLQKSVLLTKLSQAVKKNLQSAVDECDKVEELEEKLQQLAVDPQAMRDDAMDLAGECIDVLRDARDAMTSFMASNAKIPRASHLWDCPGGLTGEQALALMTRSQSAANESAQRRTGRIGRPVRDLEGRIEAAQRHMDDLMATIPRENRVLDRFSRDELRSLYLVCYQEQPNQTMNKQVLKDALESELPIQYPDFLYDAMFAAEEVAPRAESGEISDSEERSFGDVTFDDASASTPRSTSMSMEID